MLRNASRVMIHWDRRNGLGRAVGLAAYAEAQDRTAAQCHLAAACAAAGAERPRRSRQRRGRNQLPAASSTLGRFIGDSAAKLNSQLKSTNETLGNIGSQTSGAAKDAAMGAVGSARDAAGTIVGLPSARMVSGRERCAAAPNGAPDCRAAADAACRAKGFGSGRSLDTQSVQKCPARVWLSGHLPAEGECPHETFVIRAVCQ